MLILFIHRLTKLNEMVKKKTIMDQIIILQQTQTQAKNKLRKKNYNPKNYFIANQTQYMRPGARAQA